MIKLFEKQPIGTKHYSEMQVKEIRDELAAILKELRSNFIEKYIYYPCDLLRQEKDVYCMFNDCDRMRFIFPQDYRISISLIKEIQEQYSLKDTDTVSIAYNEDYDGYPETVLTFSTKVKETDLEYYQRIKELYLEQKQVDKIYKFISDIKKRTGTEMPYYAAKAAMEILESYKDGVK